MEQPIVSTSDVIAIHLSSELFFRRRSSFRLPASHPQGLRHEPVWQVKASQRTSGQAAQYFLSNRRQQRSIVLDWRLAAMQLYCALPTDGR